MKTYNVKSRLSKQAKQAIKSIISTHERYRKAYFWYPSTTSSGRRYNEKKFHSANPSVAFETAGGLIEVNFSYSESCRNVYYGLDIRLNDEKKNITVLKKLIS